MSLENVPTVATQTGTAGRPLLKHHERALVAALITFRHRCERLELWRLLGAALALRVALRDHEVICDRSAGDTLAGDPHREIRAALDAFVRLANRTDRPERDRDLIIAAAERISELVAQHDAGVPAQSERSVSSVL